MLGSHSEMAGKVQRMTRRATSKATNGIVPAQIFQSGTPRAIDR